ncbi:MAG: hypothetical protein AB1482_14450 [Pseudomonadota bacterium]
MHPVSLLVAILVLLHQPCTRNRATAALLLSRVARHAALSADEREACLNLLDELERETPAAPTVPRPRRHARPFPAF